MGPPQAQASVLQVPFVGDAHRQIVGEREQRRERQTEQSRDQQQRPEVGRDREQRGGREAGAREDDHRTPPVAAAVHHVPDERIGEHLHPYAIREQNADLGGRHSPALQPHRPEGRVDPDDQEQAPVEQRQAGAGTRTEPIPRTDGESRHVHAMRPASGRTVEGDSRARPLPCCQLDVTADVCRKGRVRHSALLPARPIPVVYCHGWRPGVRAPRRGGANGSGRMSKTPASHAPRQSSWDDPVLDDFDRPLGARGRKAARRMGGYIERNGLVPDLVMCPPRAACARRGNWRASRSTGRSGRARRGGLYLASPDRLLRAVRRVPRRGSGASSSSPTTREYRSWRSGSTRTRTTAGGRAVRRDSREVSDGRARRPVRRRAFVVRGRARAGAAGGFRRRPPASAIAGRRAHVLARPGPRGFYDRFGARQDRGALYERRPIELLIENAEARRGDRRVRVRMRHRTSGRTPAVPSLAGAGDLHGRGHQRHHVRTDARARLAPWGSRAEVRLTAGDMDPRRRRVQP